LVMLLVYIYVALASYNTGYLTLPLSSIETIIDDAANVATIDGKGKLQHSHGTSKGREKDRRDRPERERTLKDWRMLWSQGTDAVMDVPLGGVCEVLYGEFREGDDEEEELVS
jgi:phosphatidylinositol glycan class P protein